MKIDLSIACRKLWTDHTAPPDGFLRLRLSGATAHDLAGLSCVTTLRRLTIQDSPDLTDLSGLEGLTRVDQLVISSNPGLTSLSGLEGLRSAREITIQQNSRLVDLSALHGLSGERLTIRENLRLTSLVGLPDAWAANGYIMIESNPGLESLAGMPAPGPDFCGTILVEDNAGLLSLSGFPTLQSP